MNHEVGKKVNPRLVKDCLRHEAGFLWLVLAPQWLIGKSKLSDAA